MPARPVFQFASCRNLSGAMRGTVRKITLPRRLVADLMHASTRVPFVSLTRPLNVRGLSEARAQAAQRPGWAAIFVKAFALVAKEEPILRTLYVKLPLPLRRLFWAIGLNFGRQRANYFGSFGVTSVAAYGAGQLHAISPGPFILSYGVVEQDLTIDV